MPSSATSRPCSMTIASTSAQLDRAEPHAVELHAVDRHHAARGLREAGPRPCGSRCPGAPRRPRAARPGGAGVDEEAHRRAVDRAVGDEMAARVGGERDALPRWRPAPRAAVVLADLQHALLAVDLDRGAARARPRSRVTPLQFWPTLTVFGSPPSIASTAALSPITPIRATSRRRRRAARQAKSSKSAIEWRHETGRHFQARPHRRAGLFCHLSRAALDSVEARRPRPGRAPCRATRAPTPAWRSWAGR